MGGWTNTFTRSKKFSIRQSNPPGFRNNKLYVLKISHCLLFGPILYSPILDHAVILMISSSKVVRNDEKVHIFQISGKTPKLCGEGH